MARTKSEVVIYHNPSCTTSRKVLGMIREAGVEPRVVEYLKTPPSRLELVDLLRRMGMTPRHLLTDCCIRAIRKLLGAGRCPTILPRRCWPSCATGGRLTRPIWSSGSAASGR